MSLEDTIAALSTPVGESGIGIVRISGERSFPIARKIFRSPRGKKIDWTSSFRTHYGWIVDPETGKPVDEVLLTLMRAPKTYTREDIVEINCHGGSVPLRKTLEITLKSGVRLAEPGEFTKRAFLKGRIDLPQAESVLDIVQAKTEKDLEIAVHQLKGDLSSKINGIKKEMVDLLSYLEAEIEFSYEDIAPLSKKEKESRLKQILMMIDSLLEIGETSRIYRQGLKAVIIGKSNVGKSSLLNTLLQKDRAIVNYTPGTTRDTIEEMIIIKGFPLWIIDTAGLREVESQVEKEAVRRTRGKIEEANIILLMVDGSRPLDQEDESIFERIEKKKTLVVMNKIDLPQKVNKERIRYFFPGVRIVKISATQEINLNQLKEKIAAFALKEATLSTSNPLIINLRQQRALELTEQHVNRALGGLREEFSDELLAFDLKEGISRLGEITGEVVADEILDQVFSHFCIGK